MIMGIFGWSLPPGCGTLPGEEDEGPCMVCGKSIDDCICSECPVCGDAGNPKCYEPGCKCGQVRTPEQAEGLRALETFFAERAAADKAEGDYWSDPARKLEEQVWDPPADTGWQSFCRRTNDPKLAYIESLLTERGIPHRRNGESWHAPILEVPEAHMDEAWALLGMVIDGRQLDDIEDDDPMFNGFAAAEVQP